MWKEVVAKFEGLPSQKRVVELLLERGFQVSAEGSAEGSAKGSAKGSAEGRVKGRIVSGGIEIPHTQVANETGVDRRVVDETVRRILRDAGLREIFENIRSVAFLAEVAPLLGLCVVVIYPTDAREKGILGEVATVIGKRGVSIRQAVSDDPYLVDDPKLTIIADKNIPGDLIAEIGRIKSVKSVQILSPRLPSRRA
ncbi:MAG: amino acid-binding protein [Candidatus Methanophagaceae archaeon]|nr:MAG: amino acid-binding protein [Methanophagales archaeon]